MQPDYQHQCLALVVCVMHNHWADDVLPLVEVSGCAAFVLRHSVLVSR